MKFIDINPPNSLCSLDSLETPNNACCSPTDLTDASLAEFLSILTNSSTLAILDLTKSPKISKASILALQEFLKENKKVIIVAPQATDEFQTTGFLHPQIFMAQKTFEKYKGNAKKTYAFKEMLIASLTKNKQLMWFVDGCGKLEARGFLSKQEHVLLTTRDSVKVHGLLVPKVIFGLFAHKLKEDNFFNARANLKNLSHAFGVDYRLRDYYRNLIPPLVKVSCGVFHSILLTDQGLYGCGRNDYGQLGCGEVGNIHTFTKLEGIPGKIREAVCGENHTIVITDQGLYGCGSNNSGQLGRSENKVIRTFTKLEGIPGKIQEVVCGAYHTIVITDQGLYGCGSNDYDQLGCGEREYILTFTKLEGIPGKIREVVCGETHTIVITDQGLYGCGRNDYGQLGCSEVENIRTFTKLASIPGNIREVVCGENHTIVITDQGLYGCGSNYSGQLGCEENYVRTFTKLEGIPGKIQEVVCGGHHTIVITDQGLYGCGSTYSGQLGCGKVGNIRTFTKLASIPENIQEVVCGEDHTIVITDQGLYGCGSNDYGQLGFEEKFVPTFRKIAINALNEDKDTQLNFGLSN